jgi:Fe-coproporphyrin III synthase
MVQRLLTAPFSYTLQSGPKDWRPRMLTHIVTFRCNARCIMCDSWQKEGEEDMTLAEISRVYAKLPTLDLIRLSGGEPFVRPDLQGIVEAADSKLKPAHIHITTNGFLTDAIVKLVNNVRVKAKLHFLVSLDGTKNLHNRIRGRSFAWDKTIQTLQELKLLQKKFAIEVAVNQTIVDAAGMEEYQALHQFLKEHDIAHHVVFGYRESATYSKNFHLNTHKPMDGFLLEDHATPQQMQTFAQQVRKDTQTMPWVEGSAKRYYLDGLLQRIQKDPLALNPPCSQLGAHFRLYPNGDVPTCQFNAKVVGNLLWQDLAEIKSGSTYQEQKRWVRNCKGCWAECEVLPNALYSGDIMWRKKSSY